MMKKIFLIVTVLAFAFSCDNEPLEGEFVVDDGVTMTDDTTGDGSDDTTDAEPGIAAFNLDVDGVAMNPSTSSLTETSVSGTDRIHLSGVNETTNQVFGIILEKNLVAGTYAFGTSSLDEVSATYTPDTDDPSTAYISISGTFILTEATAAGKYSGSFELTMSTSLIGGEMVEVTNGVFDFQL